MQWLFSRARHLVSSCLIVIASHCISELQRVHYHLNNVKAVNFLQRFQTHLLVVKRLNCRCTKTLKRTMYQRKVDVDMLNAVKSILCSDEGLTLETSANTLFTAFSISTSTLC